MIRDTSVEAYLELVRTKKITRWQLMVLEAVCKAPGGTQGEYWSETFSEFQRHDICPRFAELRDLGAIEVSEKRPCRFTGKTCYTWVPTWNEPKKSSPKGELRKFWITGKTLLWETEYKLHSSYEEAQERADEDDVEIIEVREHR